MSFRNRPVLDRKHRPRWQDELRTQQLTVAGFALAIAVAIGIFAATAWADHYDNHLRPAAAVGKVTFDVDDLTARTDMIGSELQARYVDLQSQLGGFRDPLIQQALQGIATALQSVSAAAADSLVTGQVLADAAGRYGITVDSPAVSAEVRRRQTLVERLKVSIISVNALPKDAATGAKPTDADWARAETDIKAILDEIKGGADFAATAKDKSSDPTASSAGALGWVTGADTTYGTYFKEAHAAATGALVGPIKDETGYHILRLEARQAAGPNATLKQFLATAGVSDADYRTYVRGELLRKAFNDYFSTKVMTTYQSQREVAQILIKPAQGVPVPQQHVRHYLAAPIPGQQDQSKATDAQWAAALARAEAFRVAASKSGADWYTLTAESDDTGSASSGGDLGWYDAASSSFVPEFKDAIAKLAVGEISQPVKTQFGYHIIEVTAKRGTPGEQAGDLVTTLRAHPDQFATLARDQSEDPVSAQKGGDLGWLIRYQLDKELSDTIFAMTKPDEITDPIQTSTGFYIFKLIALSPARFVSASQLDEVRQTGFTRWLDEIKGKVQTWVAPEFAASTTGA